MIHSFNALYSKRAHDGNAYPVLQSQENKFRADIARMCSFGVLRSKRINRKPFSIPTIQDMLQ